MHMGRIKKEEESERQPKEITYKHKKSMTIKEPPSQLILELPSTICCLFVRWGCCKPRWFCAPSMPLYCCRTWRRICILYATTLDCARHCFACSQNVSIHIEFPQHCLHFGLPTWFVSNSSELSPTYRPPTLGHLRV